MYIVLFLFTFLHNQLLSINIFEKILNKSNPSLVQSTFGKVATFFVKFRQNHSVAKQRKIVQTGL